LQKNREKKMSSLPTFFQTRKPRRFHFLPRYYDPEKEALEQRIAMIEQELGLRKGEAYVPRIRRGQMISHFKRKSRLRERSSNLTLILILGLLLLLAWYLFFR